MKPVEWLEAWAKARGLWRRGASTSGWSFAPLAAGLWRVVWWTTDGHHLHGDKFDLSDDVAWLWAHAVDTGREARRRCPDCEGSKRVGRHGARIYPVAEALGEPCPTCSTKGYLDTPLARVVCEGAPRELDRCPECNDEGSCFCEICDGHVTAEDAGRPLIWPGDPTARTELLVQADVLMNPIDEAKVCAMTHTDHVLGQALALWLSGAPCEACKGERAVYWDGEDCHPPGMVDCGDCGGHGTALAAYVAQS